MLAMKNDHERIPVDDFLDVVADAPASAVSDIVDIVAGFGAEASATMLLEMIFFADPDFKAVWQEHYAFRVKAEEAVIYALLRGFVPDPNDCFDDDFFDHDNGFERWRRVTRQMLRFDARYGIDRPWLFGWAMWGESALEEYDAPPLAIDELPGAAGFAARVVEAADADYVQDLPASLRALRELDGLDDATIRKLERAILTAVLHYELPS